MIQKREILAIVLAAGLFVAARSSGEKTDDFLQDGIRLSNEGRLTEALDKLRLAAAQDAGSLRAQLALGAVALRDRKYDEALKAFASASRLDSSSETAWYGLAMIHEKFHRSSEAAEAWNRFIQITRNPELKVMAEKHLDLLRGEK